MSEVKWLIDKKFKDDEEGRAAMVKAYEGIQSRAQKAEDKVKEIEKSVTALEPIKKLNDFILKDKQTMQFLKMRKDQIDAGTKGDGLTEPQMPADYELLDIRTPGTSSFKYEQDVKEYEKEVLKQSMQKEFNVEIGKIKTSIADNLKTSQSTEDLHKALKGFGYSDKDIEAYEEFYSDPKNATIENTVDFHRLKTQELIAISPKTLQEKGFPLSSIVPGAKDLVTEPDPEAKKEMDKLMKEFPVD